jgi:hypothetical protein
LLPFAPGKNTIPIPIKNDNRLFASMTEEFDKESIKCDPLSLEYNKGQRLSSILLVGFSFDCEFHDLANEN